MQQLTYQIQAMWDAEAQVWVATSDDVPGLATEAETIETLTQKLRAMVPELLRLNAVLADHQAQAVSIVVNSHREDKIEVMA
ncbi:MAG: DUF1902 domain-containing protein [Spirulinaceae cyanobacterium]